MIKSIVADFGDGERDEGLRPVRVGSADHPATLLTSVDRLGTGAP